MSNRTDAQHNSVSKHVRVRLCALAFENDIITLLSTSKESNMPTSLYDP